MRTAKALIVLRMRSPIRVFAVHYIDATSLSDCKCEMNIFCLVFRHAQAEQSMYILHVVQCAFSLDIIPTTMCYEFAVSLIFDL